MNGGQMRRMALASYEDNTRGGRPRRSRKASRMPLMTHGELGLLAPSVLIPHRDHRGQDVVPGLRPRHDSVREHAAVPADVAELLGELSAAIPEPEPREVGDVEL